MILNRSAKESIESMIYESAKPIAGRTASENKGRQIRKHVT